MSIERERFQYCLDMALPFWVTDPGHGWLAVPIEQIQELGIAGSISGYSYLGSSHKGYDGFALLEEDCDAGVYLDAIADDACDFPEFTFDQPRCSSNVAINVRYLDSFDPEGL